MKHRSEVHYHQRKPKKVKHVAPDSGVVTAIAIATLVVLVIGFHVAKYLTQ